MENNKIDLTEVVAEANKQLLMSLDKRSIKITGCDIDCTFTYSALFRNNEDEEKGKNRMSLKDYCKQKNFNHACVYDIVQEGKKNKDGEIEVDGLKWFTKVEGSTYFIMTEKGVIDIYGGHDFQIKTPIMTISSGSIYLDDSHELFDSVFANILDHPTFANCGGYNEDIKGRELLFARNEISIAKRNNIKLGVEEIENVKK